MRVLNQQTEKRDIDIETRTIKKRTLFRQGPGQASDLSCEYLRPVFQLLFDVSAHNSAKRAEERKKRNTKHETRTRPHAPLAHIFRLHLGNLNSEPYRSLLAFETGVICKGNGIHKDYAFKKYLLTISSPASREGI
jgi:hypothetical protein